MRLKNIVENPNFYLNFLKNERHVRINTSLTGVLYAVLNELDTPTLLITNEDNLDKLAKVFKNNIVFNEFGLFPYEVGFSSKEIIFKKKKAIKSIKNTKILITTLKGIFDYAPSENTIKELTIKLNNTVTLTNLTTTLVDFGFERSAEVEHPGEFSVKGAIIDIFPFDYEKPVRIQLDFDRVEKIAILNELLLAEENVDSITISSIKYIEESEIEKIEKTIRKKLKNVNEFTEDIVLKDIEELKKSRNFGLNFYPKFLENGIHFKYRTILDYISDSTVVLFDVNIDKFLESVKEFIATQKENYGNLVEYEPIEETIKKLLLNRKVIEFGSMLENALDFHVKELSESLIMLGNLKDILINEKNRRTILIKTENFDRVKEILNAYELPYTTILEEKTGIYVQEGFFDRGFEGDKIIVLTDRELFFHLEPTKRPKKIIFSREIVSLEELKVGDLVVHRDFGIGIFRGLVKLGETPKEFLLIEYRDGEKLYVPLERIGFVEKYIGDRRIVTLNSLKGNDWAKTKEKAKESAKELAKKLLLIQAKRKIYKRPPFKPHPQEERILDLSFPYELTEDQMKAIEEVYADLEDTEPMDRLIVGDVGYGKTEVAIRASLRVVLNGKKVMVLAPTTILAMQHERTFKERLRLFPVRIEMLSRLTNTKKEKEILKDLKDGKIDIVIGTHRLLSKDVEIKDLGLLIIDEEQKFGVKHKEIIKELRATVDVLTLSATPIPRTLYASLIKLRPVSLILTAPTGRIPVKTFAMPFNVDVMKNAINYEIKRGGQVFVVYNNIEKIYSMGEFIRNLTNTKVAVAHGKMRKEVIEDVMLDFYEGKTDVLVATTIIENGLDIPTVNTLIVIEAENFGLSQMYQLRGRIGRSSIQAYAYFFYTEKSLNAIAEERLEAIREFSDEGAGLKIAMKDLEIRGAGNILGKEQHGHIISVGYNMYLSLLDQAIKELEGVSVSEVKEVSVRLNESYYIKETYIPLNAERINYYRRITLAESIDELRKIEGELWDKFGYPPIEVRNLLTVGEIMVHAREIQAREIYQEGKRVFIIIERTSKITVDDLMSLSKVAKNVQFGEDYISFEANFPLQDTLKVLHLLSGYEKVK
ncbi:transcription-repair coupling factor [Caldisericum exile]|uniref:Transcription-repair-coupling factor n=1 Tax=Caldisericum exile (strain DSM 21853 / NBRC 104410 / AZM16c01) TaxID=511051 RepID=A0A7U6GFN1_CALEA|nr:transcription-repair coupling factor [Caldisericum exile]BAL81446.1 transcription-repair-coupling factor [Caldisericum exile AZM16c01]